MRSGKNWIIMYFVLMLISQQWLFALYYLGIDLRTPSKMAAILGVFCLLAGVIKYCRCMPVIQSSRAYQLRPGLLLSVVVLLVFYGMIRGNLAYNVFMEAAGYGMIFLFLIVGRYDQFWEDIEKPMIVFFWVSFVIVVIGLFFPVGTTEQSLTFLETSSSPRQKTVGYILQNALSLWPLLFSLAYLRAKFDMWKLFGLGTLVGYMALSVYFEKRAPLARSLTYAAAVMVIVPLFQKKLRAGTAIVLLMLIGILLAAVSSSSRFQDLLDRYREKDVQHYSRSPRAEEAAAMLRELNAYELIIGRGLGGYYTSVRWKTGNSVVDDAGNRGRLNCHIGAALPMLKGGVIFLLIHVAFYLPMLLSKQRGWYRNRINTAVIAVVPVYLLFQFVESAPTFGGYMDVALVGLMWARLGRSVQPAYATQDLEYYLADEQYYSQTVFAPEPEYAQDSLAPRI